MDHLDLATSFESLKSSLSFEYGVSSFTYLSFSQKDNMKNKLGNNKIIFL